MKISNINLNINRKKNPVNYSEKDRQFWMKNDWVFIEANVVYFVTWYFIYNLIFIGFVCVYRTSNYWVVSSLYSSFGTGAVWNNHYNILYHTFSVQLWSALLHCANYIDQSTEEWQPTWQPFWLFSRGDVHVVHVYDKIFKQTITYYTDRRAPWEKMPIHLWWTHCTVSRNYLAILYLLLQSRPSINSPCSSH